MTLSMGTVRWVRSLDTVGTVRWVRRVRYGGYGGRVPLYPPYRTNRTPSPFTHRTTTTFQIGITKTNRSNDFLLKSSVLNGLGPQTVWFNKSGFPNQLVGHWGAVLRIVTPVVFRPSSSLLPSSALLWASSWGLVPVCGFLASPAHYHFAQLAHSRQPSDSSALLE